MTIMNSEQLFDANTEVQRSDINLEGANVGGNLGLEGYVLSSLFADFVFCEYIDISDGQLVSKGGIIMMEDTNKTWRKAVVRMVSPWVEKRGAVKVGDIVMFPNDKGLQTGRVDYIGADGKQHNTSHGIFLNEMRLFATLKQG